MSTETIKLKGAERGESFQRMMIMATCMLAASIYSMNLTIVSISLPHMQGTFSATPDQVSWVVTGFILGLTMMIACIGWIADQLGRKKVYLTCLVAFVFASVMCGNAHTLEEEVLWRFLQGVSGAGILPLSQSIILDVYPREQHSRVLGIWGLGNMAGPIIAPPIGGMITEAYGWQNVFDINIPAGLLALLGAALFVPSTPPARRELDVVGVVTLVGGLGLIQLMVNRGARQDWFESTEIILELVVGLALIYVFIIHILTTRKPFLNPEIFRDRNFTIGNILITSFGVFSFLPVVMLPLFMRNLMDYPVQLIGLLLVPRALGVVIGNLAVSRLVRYIDPRHLIALGLVCTMYSSWEVSTWTLDVSVWEIAVNGVFQGLGNGLIYVTVNTLTFYDLPPKHRSQGVPLFYLTFNIAASIGIAGFITYWVQSTQINHAVLTEHISPFNELMRQGFPPHTREMNAARAAALNQEITRQASLIGFEISFQLVSFVALITIPLVYLMRNPWAKKRVAPKGGAG
ncbi:MAG: MDR family MFS transporter [Alphaproteobacteria bacterium]